MTISTWRRNFFSHINQGNKNKAKNFQAKYEANDSNLNEDNNNDNINSFDDSDFNFDNIIKIDDA